MCSCGLTKLAILFQRRSKYLRKYVGHHRPPHKVGTSVPMVLAGTKSIELLYTCGPCMRAWTSATHKIVEDCAADIRLIAVVVASWSVVVYNSF